ncbi:MAG TPA: hypothetical protein VLU47_10040, partial [Blastocatellia bacterium]|nr:hypothetical protein [Blastocatellia bacterium]
ESNESRLDVITLLALLIVNSGLIMAVGGGSARFEEHSGAAETVPTVLWALQAVITFLFFVVVTRWLKSRRS